jgi:hypothetical protein
VVLIYLTADWYYLLIQFWTRHAKSSSTNILRRNFIVPVFIRLKIKIMLAALPVRWHCFQTRKVSWFTSSPAHCLLFLEMFTKPPCTLAFQTHKRHGANQEKPTPNLVPGRISAEQIAQIFLYPHTLLTLYIGWEQKSKC